MDKKDRTDELFKAGLSQFEPETPHDIWPRLSERLERKKRRKRGAYWRWASLAAALVLAFFSGYYFQISQQKQIPAYLRTLASPEQPAADSAERPANPVRRNQAQEEAQPGSPAGIEQERPANAARQAPQSATNTPANDGPIKILKEDWQQPQSGSDHYQVSQEAVSPPAIALDADPNKEAGSSEQPDHKLIATSEAISSDEASDRPDQYQGRQKASDFQDGVKVRNAELEEPPLDPRSLALQTNGELQKQKNNSPKGSLELGLRAGPALSFRNVQVNNNQGFTSQNVSNEDLQNTYSGGLAVAYRAGEHWEIQSGLYLNQWQQANSAVLLEGSGNTAATGMESYMANTSNGSLAFDGNRSNSNQTALVDGSGNSYVLLSDVEQNYRFVEIPLSLGYFLLDNQKWSWKLCAGFSSRFLNQSEVQLKMADGSSQTVNALRPNDFSLQLEAGSGLGYKLNKKLQIKLLPTLRYGLTPVSNNKAVNTYFHQFLLYSGLSYQF